MASFYTGNTGRSTGSHLDFRVWDVEKGSYTDPRGFTNVMGVDGKPLTDQFGVTSGYQPGGRTLNGVTKPHMGIDYGTPTGTKVDIAGTYLTTFNDKGGGITSQYAFTGEDGRKYEALLMHGSDQNSILSDAAITGGMAKPQPKPARVEAKTKAQEYEKLRDGKDVSVPEATKLADPPEYNQAKPFDIRDRDVAARGGYDPRFDKK